MSSWISKVSGNTVYSDKMCFPPCHSKSAKSTGIPNSDNSWPPHCPPDARITQNHRSAPIWKLFGHQVAELLKMRLLRPPGSHLATRCQNCSKWAFWDHLGAMWPPAARIAPNEPSETIWEPFGHQVPELLKIRFLRPSGHHLATRCQNCSKWAFWDHLGAIWPPGGRIAQNEVSEATWEPFGHQVPELPSKVSGNTVYSDKMCFPLYHPTSAKWAGIP